MNLIGALRRSMATTGYTELKEFQRVEIVVEWGTGHTGSPPTGMRTILGLLLAATLLSGCGGGPSGGDTEITVEPRLPGADPRRVLSRCRDHRARVVGLGRRDRSKQGGDLATCADPGAWPPSGEPAEGIPYVGRPTWTSDVCGRLARRASRTRRTPGSGCRWSRGAARTATGPSRRKFFMACR